MPAFASYAFIYTIFVVFHFTALFFFFFSFLFLLQMIMLKAIVRE